MCCGSWGCKVSDMTERLNGTELVIKLQSLFTKCILTSTIYCLTICEK